MIGWVGDIEKDTLANSTFRTVLFTGKKMQRTVMSLAAGGEIGLEMDDDVEQFIRTEEGRARATFGPSREEVSETHHLEDDFAIIIPAGTWHNLINAGDGALKLYSLYSPPEHPDGTVHPTRPTPTQRRQWPVARPATRRQPVNWRPPMVVTSPSPRGRGGWRKLRTGWSQG